MKGRGKGIIYLFKLLVILGHGNHIVKGIGGLLLGMVLRVIMSL